LVPGDTGPIPTNTEFMQTDQLDPSDEHSIVPSVHANVDVAVILDKVELEVKIMDVPDAVVSMLEREGVELDEATGDGLERVELPGFDIEVALLVAALEEVPTSFSRLETVIFALFPASPAQSGVAGTFCSPK
jgi:hypothetical protein